MPLLQKVWSVRLWWGVVVTRGLCQKHVLFCFEPFATYAQVFARKALSSLMWYAKFFFWLPCFGIIVNVNLERFKMHSLLISKSGKRGNTFPNDFHFVRLSVATRLRFMNFSKFFPMNFSWFSCFAACHALTFRFLCAGWLWYLRTTEFFPTLIARRCLFLERYCQSHNALLWSFAVENENHCDFVKLREMLVRVNMEDLREKTHTKHYELYRRGKLTEMGFVDEATGGKDFRCFGSHQNSWFFSVWL